MGRVIAVANQKGGVGKTTTAVNLAAALARLGKRVLLLDMDPQGNATVSLGVDKDALTRTLYDVLIGEAKLKQVLVTAEEAGVEVAPANGDLTAAEVDLLEETLGPKRLRKVLKKVRDDYDALIVDCPPTLNMLTLNALVAADGVVVPVQCEYFALEGLSALMDTIEKVQEGPNPHLQIDGLLRTMHDRRNNLANDVSNELLAHFGMKVLTTIVPRNVRLAEAPSYGQSILDYDASSTGAMAYLALANELTRRTGL